VQEGGRVERGLAVVERNDYAAVQPIHMDDAGLFGICRQLSAGVASLFVR